MFAKVIDGRQDDPAGIQYCQKLTLPGGSFDILQLAVYIE